MTHLVSIPELYTIASQYGGTVKHKGQRAYVRTMMRGHRVTIWGQA